MAVFATVNYTHPNAHMPPETAGLYRKKSGMSKKGKGKENIANISSSTQPVDQLLWGEGYQEDSWQWRFLTEFFSSKVPPLFSKDGSYFFSLVGTSVKIFSSSTGKVLSTLSTPALKNGRTQSGRLTSALINPHNAFQLITSTLDGRLLIWDFVTATLLRTIEVGQPIYLIAAHEKFRDSLVAAVALPNKRSSDHDAVILRVSLKPVVVGQSSSEIFPIGKTRFPAGLSFSANGTWLVVAGGHTIYVARTSSFEVGFIKYVSPERLTCLAVHPQEEYLATGDEKGIIRLWYCLNNMAMNARGLEKRAQTSSLHWHAHAVSSIAFTNNGAYLLSGGEEAVLVIWQLHTGKKEFVPRVGSAISTISVPNGNSVKEYLIGLTDATLCFVDSSSLRATRNYSQIKANPAPSTSLTHFYPLAVHFPSASIIFPSSHPSTLQVYSPTSLTLLCEVEVSHSNRVSRRDEKTIEPSRITQVAVSSSGSWLSTLDVRVGEPGYSPEVFLKVWAWDRKTTKWVLHTRIDQPHGVKNVVHLAFSPEVDSRPLFLTSSGEDGYVKIWRLLPKGVWTPHSSIMFCSSFRLSLTWSPDATIFAVSLGEQVAVCDPYEAIVRQTLCSSESQTILYVHFIGNRHLLAIGTKNMALWDLVEHTVCWHYLSSLNIDSVIPHPQGHSFAVFYQPDIQDISNVTKIDVFRITSSNPRSVHVPFRIRNVVWYGLSSPSSGFSLVGLTSDLRLVAFGDEATSSEIGMTLPSVSTSRRSALFADLFGQSAIINDSIPSLVSNTKVPQLTDNKRNDIQDIFSGPAHLTPPLELLFEPLVTTFLHQPFPDQVVELDRQQETDTEVEFLNVDHSEEKIMTTGRTAECHTDLEKLTQLFRRSLVKEQVNGQGRLNATANGFTADAYRPVSLVQISSPDISMDLKNTQDLSTESHAPVFSSSNKHKESLA